MEAAAAEAWLEAKKRIRESKSAVEFASYADDPVGFGERVLGDHFTDDVKRMMESVRDNRIYIARRGNATGKTRGAPLEAI